MDDGQATGRAVIRRRRASELKVRDADFLDACIAVSDLTGVEIARLVGVSPGFVSHLRTGRKGGCKAYTAQALARVLGRPTADLFTAGQAPKRRPRRTPTTALEG